MRESRKAGLALPQRRHAGQREDRLQPLVLCHQRMNGVFEIGLTFQVNYHDGESLRIFSFIVMAGEKAPTLTPEAPSCLTTGRTTLDALVFGIGRTSDLPANCEDRDRRLQCAGAVFRHRRFAPVGAQWTVNPAGRSDGW